LPIKCPKCGGKSTAKGGTKRKSPTLVKRYYICTVCKEKTPKFVESKLLDLPR